MNVPTSPTESQESPSCMYFCRMCQSVYRQPKLLPCLHSFCSSCLEGVVTNRRDDRVIVCSQCSHQATLPPSGVAGIPDNIFLNRMCQDYISEVQSTLVAKSLNPGVSRSSSSSEIPRLPSRFSGELARSKFSSASSSGGRYGSQDEHLGSGKESPPGRLSIDRSSPSGQSTANALEAIRNMSRLQTKIMSLQGDALRVTYAIDQVNQSMVEWHQHKEDLKRSIQRRSSQFQFFIKRIEHQLVSQIDGKQADDMFYAESDRSKSNLRDVLRNILHEVSVLKNVQEFGKDAEINALSGNLLSKSVGMSEVVLKKIHFDINTPTKSIDDLVEESFGSIKLCSEDSQVFSPEILDFTNIPVGNAAVSAEGSGVSSEQPQQTPLMNEEEFETAISRVTKKRSSDRRSRRHNTDLGLDKEDVKEYLAQFQTARETFRTRRREILAQGQKAREDASPYRDEIMRRPRSSSRKGRVQSLDRVATPVTIKAGTVEPADKLNAKQQSEHEASNTHPDFHSKFHYGAAGVIPEDITLPSPVIEEISLPSSPQRRLVKQTSDPPFTHDMMSSPEETSSSDISPSSHTQSFMEQLRSRRFSNPTTSLTGRRYSSDQSSSLFSSDFVNLDFQGHDRSSARPARRSISNAGDRKSKMDFLRETWQKRKEILIQNEGFISADSHQPIATLRPLPHSQSETHAPAPSATNVRHDDKVLTKVTQDPYVSPDDSSKERVQQMQSRLAHYKQELATVNGTHTGKKEASQKVPEQAESSKISGVPSRLTTGQTVTSAPISTLASTFTSASIPISTLASTLTGARVILTPAKPLKESTTSSTLATTPRADQVVSPVPFSTPASSLTGARVVLTPAKSLREATTLRTDQKEPTTPTSSVSSTVTTVKESSALATSPKEVTPQTSITRESRYSKYYSKPTETLDIAFMIAAMYSGNEKSIIHSQTPKTANQVTASTVNAGATKDGTRGILSEGVSTAANESAKPAEQAPTSPSVLSTTSLSKDSSTRLYEPRKSRYGSRGENGQGFNRRHTIEIGKSTIQSALQAISNNNGTTKPPSPLQTIPDSPTMQETPKQAVSQTRLVDRLRYGIPKPESEAMHMPSIFQTTDGEEIKDTTISYNISAKGVTTKTIPYPLVLESVPDETLLEKSLDQQPNGATACARPLSPSPSAISPTANDAKGRLRELARKKRERWRHLTIH